VYKYVLQLKMFTGKTLALSAVFIFYVNTRLKGRILTRLILNFQWFQGHIDSEG